MDYIINLLLIPVYYFAIINTFKDKQKAYKFFSILVGIHAILFRALANPYNYVDTEIYVNSFNAICGMSFEDSCLKLNVYSATGHGFVIYQWLLGHIVENEYFLYFVTAVINVSLVVWYYRKISNDIFLPLIIFLAYPMLYYMSFGVIRQHLAAALILIALFYVDDLKKSIPFFIIAMSIHPSAMVFGLYYAIRNISLYSMNLIKILLYAFIFSFAVGYVLNVISND